MAEYVYTGEQYVGIGDPVVFNDNRVLIDKGKAINHIEELRDFTAFDDHYGTGYTDGLRAAETILQSMNGEEPAHLCNSCKYIFPVCQAKAKFERCRDKILSCWKYEDRTDNSKQNVE